MIFYLIFQCDRYQPVYIAYRALWVIWWTVVYLSDYIPRHDKDLYFIYLTNWTYILLGISAALQQISAIYSLLDTDLQVGQRAKVLANY